jgi:epoxyqueuosine reductase
MNNVKNEIKQPDQYKNKNPKEITRREFLNTAMILGLSLGGAKIIAGCNGKPGLISNNVNTESIPTPQPSIDELEDGVQVPSFWWYCAACGNQFRNAELLKEHAYEEHAWRLPHINRVDKPTYTKYLVERIRRFDERNTAFSRTVWDHEYRSHLMDAMAKAPKRSLEDLEGLALIAGGIYVDATAGSFHPDYTGYMGHIADFGGLYGWDDPVNPEKFPIASAEWMSERIKHVARLYGADLVGICKVDRRWVYSHSFERTTGRYARLSLPYKYAIVLGTKMSWRHLNDSPRPEASAVTALGYSKMAFISASLAKYIRALGYPAVPSGNDTSQNIPMAIDAGLGELGRNGLLLTPEYGPRVRICKVFTDLPLVPDAPIDFGIQEHCESCRICSHSCPVDAIQRGERTTEITSISNRPGILRWVVDVGRCLLYWRENNMDCSNCVAVCPWAMHSQRNWLLYL